jgi:hypothetical protein
MQNLTEVVVTHPSQRHQQSKHSENPTPSLFWLLLPHFLLSHQNHTENTPTKPQHAYSVFVTNQAPKEQSQKQFGFNHTKNQKMHTPGTCHEAL